MLLIFRMNSIAIIILTIVATVFCIAVIKENRAKFDKTIINNYSIYIITPSYAQKVRHRGRNHIVSYTYVLYFRSPKPPHVNLPVNISKYEFQHLQPDDKYYFIQFENGVYETYPLHGYRLTPQDKKLVVNWYESDCD